MFKKNKKQTETIKEPKEKKVRTVKVGTHKKTVIALWVVLVASVSFGVYKNFTAIDQHTTHEKEIIELCLQDTNGIENFVKNFAKSYYTWDNSKEAIEARTQAISGYLTKELQDLNVDTIRTDEVLKPTADLAFAGDGNFLCGEWCGFCKAKHECRARAEANLLLAQHDFKLPPLLEDSEIEVILSRVDELVSWANDIKEYALQQAISGKEWTCWKLVESRSNRRYTNEDDVSKAVEAAGFDPYEKKLLGITAMQKLLGKSRFEDLLADYIEKPQGKPTLVPESDKRPAMNTAKNDFMEEYDNE